MDFRRNKKLAQDEVIGSPLEVVVWNNNFEEAFRRFKMTVQNEGVIAAYKTKQAYEKPSEKKRRKIREAQEARRVLEMRENLIASGEWEKRLKKKEQKRQEKAEEKRKQKLENE